MYFDVCKAETRIQSAQQRLNTAPSERLTQYWFRIWRARRLTYRIYLRKCQGITISKPSSQKGA